MAREQDLRAGPHGVEFSAADMTSGRAFAETKRQRVPFCNRCSKPMKEKSRTCPFCDRKDQMGYVSPIRR
jgi:hypothetical protein